MPAKLLLKIALPGGHLTMRNHTSHAIPNSSLMSLDQSYHSLESVHHHIHKKIVSQDFIADVNLPELSVALVSGCT